MAIVKCQTSYTSRPNNHSHSVLGGGTAKTFWSKAESLEKKFSCSLFFPKIKYDCFIVLGGSVSFGGIVMELSNSPAACSLPKKKSSKEVVFLVCWWRLGFMYRPAFLSDGDLMDCTKFMSCSLVGSCAAWQFMAVGWSVDRLDVRQRFIHCPSRTIFRSEIIR